MPLWLTIILIILAVVAAILVVLYFVGTKLQKKQAEQQSMMEAMAHTVSMLVIDKKRMKLKDAGFPPMVYEQRYQIEIVKSQLGKLRNHGLNKQCGFLRIKTAGQIIQRYLHDILADLFRMLRIVGQRLGIGDHNIDLIERPGILKPYPLL